MAMMTHTSSQTEYGKFAYGGTNNGIVAKNIRFVGKASHAGGAPHDGVNALNAAMIAMSAIHAQRETYRDQDTIRIHPIITQGGVAVSSVPADVRMETFVRGRSIEAFLSANQKVDCALRAGAMAVGGSVEITTLPGYLPLQNNNPMLELYRDNASALVGANHITELGHRTGSTDMGDVSQLMPAIHPYVVAASGTGHGVDYVVEDYDLAVLTSAKAMAMTVIDLLANGAQHAKTVKERYQAPLTKSAYLSLMRSMHEEATYTE
jgi:metal-dependent amidase/aminoacylase/carboxypeptidase family protein